MTCDCKAPVGFICGKPRCPRTADAKKALAKIAKVLLENSPSEDVKRASDRE